MYSVSYNNRVHGQKPRLDINFLNRCSRSSFGSLKPKHLQQLFITATLDVLNNFSRKRVTAKSSECNSAFVSGQTSKPYKKMGMHFVVTRCVCDNAMSAMTYATTLQLYDCCSSLFVTLFLTIYIKNISNCIYTVRA